MHPDIMDCVSGDMKLISAFHDFGHWLFPQFYYKVISNSKQYC